MARIDEALELIDIEAWLSEYVDTKEASSSNIKLEECPKCGNSKYKLYVNVDTKKWYCQRCEWGRGYEDPTILMAEVSGRALYDIRKELSSMVAPTTPASAFMQKLQAPITKEQIKLESLILPGEDNFNDYTGLKVLEYAMSRGLNANHINEYKLRFSTKLKNIKIDCLLFPIYYEDIIVGWQGRRISDREPKYISGENIKNNLWPISNGIANYTFNGEVVLVEGVFDALGAISCGYRALSTFGKAISLKQIQLLKNLKIKKIYLCWDLDAAKDVATAAKRLSAYFDVQIVDLSHEMQTSIKIDPGEILINKELQSWFTERMDRSLNIHDSRFFEWQIGIYLND